jgi:DNA-binding SARP family transcriptional activator
MPTAGRHQPISLAVHLLGRPRVVPASGEGYQFRSRKSWAILAYLILSDRPPTRSTLASLLFAEADDPARALRWSLSEIRRVLGAGGSIDGDPVVLRLPDGAVVDVDVVVRGSSAEAVELPGFGAELLEGMAFRGAAAYETWLLSEQRRLAATLGRDPARGRPRVDGAR